MNNLQKKLLKQAMYKRSFDLVVATSLLIAFSPILLLCALLVLLFEGRPIFYKSSRMISAQKNITIYKFRTMQTDANSERFKLNERFMRNGYLDIPLDCEVYTPIGRILERLQIVELLQLINVLRNEMSIVGNRPLPSSNVEILKSFTNWNERFMSPSGITGITQIVGKYQLDPSIRLELESMYSSIYHNPNGNIFLCDCNILWRTFILLFTHKYISHQKGILILTKYGARQPRQNLSQLIQ